MARWAVLAVGATGYGLSLRFYLLAQRAFGAARTGSVFAFAPFIGAAAAFGFGERSSGWLMLLGGTLMLVGVALHLAESHGHEHTHEMLEHEQPHLMPMVTPFDGYVEQPGRVSSTCLISAARNHYSVPCELAGKLISKRFYPERIAVIFDDTVVASHPRLFERGQTGYDWRHYISLVERKPGVLRNGAPFGDMPEPLVRLQRLLLKREGGDRVMSQVLCAVPKAGLEPVLVAVELVLESGAVSAEHVLNVLSRLNSAALPAQVETTLRIKEAPLANTDRYDALRQKAVNHA